MGRPPSAISDEQRKIICEVIEQGNTLRVAAQKAGVHWDTFKYWRRMGITGNEPYATFLTLTRNAEANAEAKMVGYVTGAAAIDAKHAQWWLERRKWKDWYQRKEATNKDPARMSDEELRAALERELRALDERKKRDDDD